MTVWQVAAGNDQRDYVAEFLLYGLAFVGGERQIRTLSEVQEGDLLVLKRGVSKVEAVGRVVVRGGVCGGDGDKPWLRDFDGWDLRAYRYVEWRRPASELPSDGLRMGTIARVNHPSLREAAIAAFETGVPESDPEPEPGPTEAVPDERILGFLISQGLSPRLAEELTQAFARTRRLANYYRQECEWADVREHETRTFLAVTLLLALGWAEQQMKIELAVPKRAKPAGLKSRQSEIQTRDLALDNKTGRLGRPATRGKAPLGSGSIRPLASH